MMKHKHTPRIRTTEEEAALVAAALGGKYGGALLDEVLQRNFEYPNWEGFMSDCGTEFSKASQEFKKVAALDGLKAATIGFWAGVRFLATVQNWREEDFGRPTNRSTDKSKVLEPRKEDAQK